MFSHNQKLRYKDWVALLNSSPDFRIEVFLLTQMLQQSLEKVVALKDGGLAIPLRISPELASVLECPPTLDLEPELIEPEEDCEIALI